MALLEGLEPPPSRLEVEHAIHYITGAKETNNFILTKDSATRGNRILALKRAEC